MIGTLIFAAEKFSVDGVTSHSSPDDGSRFRNSPFGGSPSQQHKWFFMWHVDGRKLLTASLKSSYQRRDKRRPWNRTRLIPFVVSFFVLQFVEMWGQRRHRRRLVFETPNTGSLQFARDRIDDFDSNWRRGMVKGGRSLRTLHLFRS